MASTVLPNDWRFSCEPRATAVELRNLRDAARQLQALVRPLAMPLRLVPIQNPLEPNLGPHTHR